MSEHLQPGWGRPVKSHEAHYFYYWSNGLSLCKVWRYRGPRGDAAPWPVLCLLCQRKLSELKGTIEV